MNYAIARVAVVSIALAAVFTACSPQPEAPAPRPTDAPLTLLQEPPSRPPKVAVGGVETAPAYYEWLIDGGFVTYQAAEDQADVELPVVATDHGRSIEVAVDSPVMPADFVVVAFDELKADGTPSDSGHSIDCLRAVDDCKLTIDEDSGVSARLLLSEQPQIIVVHLMYVSLPDGATEATHLTGSWGVRIDAED